MKLENRPPISNLLLSLCLLRNINVSSQFSLITGDDLLHIMIIMSPV